MGTTVLASLLSRFPSAKVAAIDEAGVAVPVPDGVPLDDHVTVASTFEVVVPADRVVIVGLYGRARSSGIASGPVHLAEDPDRAVTVCVLDVRPRFGVLLVIFGDRVEDGSDPGEQWSLPQLPPRLARASKDGSAVYVSVDQAVTEILGWPADELVGRRALEIVHPDDRDTAIANWIEMLATPGLGRRVRLRHQHREGRWVWLEITNRNRLDDPAHEDVVAEMVDISEEMAAHEALRQREQLLHEIAQTVPLGLFHADRDGNILFANTCLSDILGVERTGTIADLVRAVDPDDRSAVDEALLQALAGRGDVDLEVRIRSSEGVRYAALRLRAPEIARAGLPGIIGCLEDVTDAAMMRRRLEVQATFDPLTECRNRYSTMAAVDAAITRLDRRAGIGMAILYIDLDQFKPVNDSYGHSVGDQVLVVVAERLGRGIRPGDIVGRIGGDEFVVICHDVSSSEDALRIGGAVADRLCGTVHVDGREVPIFASVGVAWTDDEEVDAEALLDAADAAMYESKGNGRCRPVLTEVRPTRRASGLR
ncbi:MAG: diguanylate cyclase [Acidimicrobiales bacterium]